MPIARRTIRQSRSVPTPAQAVELIEYLFARTPRSSLKLLFLNTSDHVQTVRARKIPHDLFDYRGDPRPKASSTRSFLFHDSGTAATESVRSQLLLLEDTSWLLYRQHLTQDDQRSPMMHYRTPELQPVFTEYDICGQTAVEYIRKLVTAMDGSITWSTDWLALRLQIKQRYPILM